MGRRSKQRNQQHRKSATPPVALQLAGDEGDQGSSDSDSFSLRWGPSRRGGYGGGVAAPQRFVRDSDALSSYALIPLVYTCVATIAESVAMLPLRIERNGETLPPQQPSRIRDLLNAPNPYMSRFELLEYIATYVELVGDAHLLCDELDGYARPRTLWPLYSVLVEPDVHDTEGIVGYDYHLGAKGVRFDPADILHIKRGRPDDFYRGLGTVQAGARALEEADNTAAWSGAFFRNGATIAGVLETDKVTIPPMERQRVEDDWRTLAAGVDNAYKTLILTAGLKYKQVGANPGNIGLADLRKLTREDILILFRMPPTKVGIYDHANYKAEQADRDFWQQCMTPRVLRIQMKLQELADRFGEGDQIVFELPEFKDIKVLAETAEIMGRTGRFTDNEIRELLGYARDKDGDRYRVPLSLITEPYVPEQQQRTGKAGGKAPSALHQDALTAAALREKQETEALAAKAHSGLVTRFFDDQQERIVAAIESAGKAAGGTRKMYDQKALSITGVFNRRKENAALYAVGRIVHSFAGERAATWLGGATGVEASWKPDDPVSQQILEKLAKRPEFVGINDTTRGAIEALLSTAEQRKYSVDQLINGVPSENFAGIKGVFDAAKQSRVATIVRNEVATAWNTSMLELGTAYGVTKWLIRDGEQHTDGPAGPDGLTCAERNGLIVDSEAAALHCRGSHPNCMVFASPFFGTEEIGERI